jgi:hypothetical protein
VEALHQENLVAHAAPEPGARRRSKLEYELIAARLDGQLDLLNKRLRAVSAPELPDALMEGDLKHEWSGLPFYARRRIVEALIARVTLLPTGRGLSGIQLFIGEDRLDILSHAQQSHTAAG